MHKHYIKQIYFVNWKTKHCILYHFFFHKNNGYWEIIFILFLYFLFYETPGDLRATHPALSRCTL